MPIMYHDPTINWPDEINKGAMNYPAVLDVTFDEESDTEPVTLTEAKAWCAIDGTDFDSTITDLISTAREMCEAYVNKSFIERIVTAKLRAKTKLPYGPAAYEDITALTDEDGNTLTSNYEDLTSGIYIVTYPVTPDPKHYRKFRAAMRSQIVWMYQHRGDEDFGQLSPEAKSKLKPIRVLW